MPIRLNRIAGSETISHRCVIVSCHETTPPPSPPCRPYPNVSCVDSACFFTTRLQVPCVAPTQTQTPKEDHTVRYVCLGVGGFLLLGLIVGGVVFYLKKKKNSDGRNFNGDASLLGANDFGDSESGFTTASQSQF